MKKEDIDINVENNVLTVTGRCGVGRTASAKVSVLDPSLCFVSALQEALADLQSQRMNNALYLLSLYTALFLPMGMLTGLLGS